MMSNIKPPETSWKFKELPPIGNVGMVDVLANGAAAIIVLVALVISHEQGQVESEIQSEQEISLILARRIVSYIESGALPVYGPVTVLNKEQKSRKISETKKGIYPLIVLENHSALITATGKRLTRKELLEDDNELDRYLQGLSTLFRRHIVLEIRSIKLFYVVKDIIWKNDGKSTFYLFESETQNISTVLSLTAQREELLGDYTPESLIIGTSYELAKPVAQNDVKEEIYSLDNLAKALEGEKFELRQPFEKATNKHKSSAQKKEIFSQSLDKYRKKRAEVTITAAQVRADSDHTKTREELAMQRRVSAEKHDLESIDPVPRKSSASLNYKDQTPQSVITANNIDQLIEPLKATNSNEFDSITIDMHDTALTESFSTISSRSYEYGIFLSNFYNTQTKPDENYINTVKKGFTDPHDLIEALEILSSSASEELSKRTEKNESPTTESIDLLNDETSLLEAYDLIDNLLNSEDIAFETMDIEDIIEVKKLLDEIKNKAEEAAKLLNKLDNLNNPTCILNNNTDKVCASLPLSRPIEAIKINHPILQTGALMGEPCKIELNLYPFPYPIYSTRIQIPKGTIINITRIDRDETSSFHKVVLSFPEIKELIRGYVYSPSSSENQLDLPVQVNELNVNGRPLSEIISNTGNKLSYSIISICLIIVLAVVMLAKFIPSKKTRDK